MACSLWNLVNNLSEWISRIRCKFAHHNKKCETCSTKYKYSDCFREFTNFKSDFIESKFLWRKKKNYQRKFDKKLKEQFFNTYKFHNLDNNKFILLLQKGVYSYQYMGDW